MQKISNGQNVKISEGDRILKLKARIRWLVYVDAPHSYRSDWDNRIAKPSFLNNVGP